MKLDQALVENAKLNLGYTAIISPVDGTVVSRNVTQGQTVASSFQTPTLFLIATDLKKMEVDTNTSESDIGQIRQGDKATFTVDAYPQRVFKGAVTQVRQSPQTVQNVVTYDVVIGRRAGRAPVPRRMPPREWLCCAVARPRRCRSRWAWMTGISPKS